MTDLDLLVVGGGTGGLVSALVGAGIGARVALAERDRLGGDCLWTGCVPSKSLLAAAGLAHRMRHADAVGLQPLDPPVDLARVMDHVRSAQRVISAEDSAARLARDGVEVLDGDARFVDPQTAEIGGRRLRFRAAIIATGSRPTVPEIPGLDDVSALTTDTVWSLDALPGRLVVLGAGASGCELAQGFARLGAAVTLVESGPRVLPAETPAASALLAATLRAEGVDVRCGTDAVAVRVDGVGDGGGSLSLGDGSSVGFDRLLLATGREPVTDGLDPGAAGVRLGSGGEIVVDDRLRTSARGVYAVGDVTGGPRFTHVAAHHARVATVNALFGARGRVERRAVPRVAFTDPEIASVGLDEDAARARWGGRATAVGFDYADSDRAIAEGRARGFATLVGDPRGRLVGATIAAPGAGESIAELTAWVASGAKLARVSQTIHAYPTLSEGPARAADAYLRARYARPGIRRAARTAMDVRAALHRLR